MKRRTGNKMSLSSYGGLKAEEEDSPVEPQQIAVEPKPIAQKPGKKQQTRLVTVNIKITEQQQEWLADTAKQVRQNNDTPTPAGDRVYPQHLIQVAIELLKSADVEWDEIHNVEDLKQQLNL